MSLRRRLVLLCALAVAAAIAAAATASYVIVRSELTGQVDEALEQQSGVISRLSRDDLIDPRALERSQFPTPSALPFAAQEFTAQLLRPSGRVAGFPSPTTPIATTRRDEAIAGSGVGATLEDREVGGETYRVLTRGLGDGGGDHPRTIAVGD